MKKALVFLAAIALVLWVISWFRAPKAVVTSSARSWPGGLGSLDAVDARFPTLHANAASVKFTKLANALPKNDAVYDYVSGEIGRGELTIGEAPKMAEVSAIRELLLREPIVWDSREGIGGDTDTQTRRGMLMTTARMLIASALVKARANDPAAWDDLHAVWKLAHTLDGQPQMLMQSAALAMVRNINAVAWKMPLPAPAWFSELQAEDRVKPLLASFQFQSGEYVNDGMRLFPTKMLANSVDHDRTIAEELIKETRCDVTVRPNELGVDLTPIWERAFRYRAEREATANAIRVREAKSIEAKSQCSDGSWTYDGTTLRFSREIPTAAPDKPMPLVLRVSAR